MAKQQTKARPVHERPGHEVSLHVSGTLGISFLTGIGEAAIEPLAVLLHGGCYGAGSLRTPCRL